jgi:hypothetical protein
MTAASLDLLPFAHALVTQLFPVFHTLIARVTLFEHLGKYATLAEVTNLNSAVQSGLNAQEVAILKSVLNSTQIDDALTSLGVQRAERTTTNATATAQYLRHLKSRNYVIY